MIYTCSDIHGNYDAWIKMLELIDFKKDDTMYVLGDVCDRGPNGIKILKDIMNRTNVILLKGNHEWFIEIFLSLNVDNPEYDDFITFWLENGGAPTLEEISNSSDAEIEEILDFIKNLPTQLDINVNGINYGLVHAEYSDNIINRLEGYVYNNFNKKDFTIIFGHRGSHNFNLNLKDYSIYKGDNAIGLDCSLMTDYYKRGYFGCLRLDDMEEFYLKYSFDTNQLEVIKK